MYNNDQTLEGQPFQTHYTNLHLKITQPKLSLTFNLPGTYTAYFSIEHFYLFQHFFVLFLCLMFILRGLSAQLQHYYLKVFPRPLKFYYSELILYHFTHYNGFTLCFTSVVGVFLFQRSTIYL